MLQNLSEVTITCHIYHDLLGRVRLLEVALIEKNFV